MAYDDWHALREDGWTIALAPENQQPKDYSYVLYEAKPPENLPICRECGRRYRFHDSRPRLYRDLPEDGFHCLLSVPRRRLKCCRGLSTERLEALDEKRMATRALVAQIERASLERRKFTDISRLYGIEHKTVRDINRDYIARKDRQREERHALIIPQHLGIHPLKMSRQECCLLTNVERRTVFEVTRNQSVAAIKDRFQKLFKSSDLERVHLVSIPLNDDYKRLAKKLFPKARILVPTRYLVSIAGEVMERAVEEMKSGTRTRNLQTLKKLVSVSGMDLDPTSAARLRKELSLHHQLHAAYLHKEWFLKILTSQDKTKTLAEYNQWCRATPPELRGIFNPMFSGVSRWKTNIFPNTDIYYSEYLLNLEKLIEDLLVEGRAYSFEVIRGRLLYRPDFQINLQRTPTRQSACEIMSAGPRVGISPTEEDIRVEFGSSFEKISKNLER